MDIWSREEELIRRNAAIDNRSHGCPINPLRKSRSISKIPTRGGVSPEKRTQSHLKNDSGLKHKKVDTKTRDKGSKDGIHHLYNNNDTNKSPALSIEIEALKKEKSTLQSKLDRLNESESRRSNEINELKLKMSEAQRNLSNLSRESEEKERINKKLESQIKSLNVRLERQDETIDRLRKESTELKDLNKNTKESLRGEKEEISKKCKALERDFEKMTMAYSKQQELVEVLKKQKIHLEVAQVLQFTEEEFIKSLNWNVPQKNVSEEIKLQE